MGIYDELSQLESPTGETSLSTPSPSAPAEPEAPTAPADAMTSRRRDVLTGVETEATSDAVATLLEGVDLVKWREVLSDTETHNSTYRLTEEERRAAEDLVRDLWRKDQVKTSMNELARLGLMLLAFDYRRRSKLSIIYRVKKP